MSRSERTYGNGGQRRDYVDRDGRLYSIVSNLHQGFRYGFDANGRLTQLTNFAEPAQGLWSQSYGYDHLNRLTSANSAGLGNQGFQYDPNGNRTRHTRGGSVSDYTIASTSNRLTAITGTGARSYTYKATGQVSAITGAMGGNWIFRNGFQHASAQTTTFTYDPFNRLSQISGPGINASYKLAATGMRVEKSTGGQTTRFVYGMNGQLLYERNLGTNQRSHYLYLDGQPVGLVRNGTLHYVLPDHLGRPEVIVDQNQNQVWRATLSAFERRVIRDQIGGYHLGFPGQYHDTETGFAYNVHRDYDPATGRYLQSDPIGLAGGLNTYTYAGNSPVTKVDPLGLCECSAPSQKQPEVTVWRSTSRTLGPRNPYKGSFRQFNDQWQRYDSRRSSFPWVLAGWFGSYGDAAGTVKYFLGGALGDTEGFYAETGNTVVTTIFDVDGRVGVNVSLVETNGDLIGTRNFIAERCLD